MFFAYVQVIRPIVAIALRVGFQEESLGSATGGLSCKCSVSEAWKEVAAGHKTNIAHRTEKQICYFVNILLLRFLILIEYIVYYHELLNTNPCGIKAYIHGYMTINC